MPPPAKVLADADMRLIVPVPVTVRLVEVVALKVVPEPAKDHVPLPKPTVLCAVADIANVDDAPLRVTLYTFALNVPIPTVNAPEPEALITSASCSVTTPDGLCMLIN